MPEGHSLELAARRLAPMVGSEVLDGPLAGARVTAVEARGKHLLIHADDGRSADVHLGMHGGVRLVPAGDGPAPPALNRAVMHTAAGDAVLVGRLRIGRSSAGRGLGPTCCTAASTRASTCAGRALSTGRWPRCCSTSA